MSRRKLGKEELALWHKVTEQAEPLHAELRKPEVHPPAKKPSPPKIIRSVESFSIGAKAAAMQGTHDIAGDIRDQIRTAPVKVDRKTHQNLKRGKLKPEARIDLHGMTLDQAHPRLAGFIIRSQAEGKRLVLVITGKGKHRDDGGPIPVRFGILRHQVPQWLTTPPLNQVVLQISEAHLKHGGGGAYYVYLRRKR